MNPRLYRVLTFCLLLTSSAFAGEREEIDKALKLYGKDVQQIQEDSQKAFDHSIQDVEEFLNNPEGAVSPQESFFGFKDINPKEHPQKAEITSKVGKSCFECGVHSTEGLRFKGLAKSVPSENSPSKDIENQQKKPHSFKQSPLSFSQASSLQVIVFVSLGMTDVSLKALAREAEVHGARLVIRGLLEGSFPKTVKRIQELKIALEIDPPLFEQFKVERVPTFVRCKLHQGEPLVKGHDRLSGNVPLHTALELFKEKGTLL